MDKEKQRDALLEYMKMQQQKIRNTADSSLQQPAYSSNRNTTKSNNYNRNSLAYLVISFRIFNLCTYQNLMYFSLFDNLLFLSLQQKLINKRQQNAFVQN